MTKCPKCENDALYKTPDCVWCTDCDFFADGDAMTEALQHESKCDAEALRARLQAAERVMLKCAMVMQWVIDDEDTGIYRTDLEDAIKEIDEYKKGQ